MKDEEIKGKYDSYMPTQEELNAAEEDLKKIAKKVPSMEINKQSILMWALTKIFNNEVKDNNGS